jgi:hypothetical protein
MQVWIKVGFKEYSSLTISGNIGASEDKSNILRVFLPHISINHQLDFDKAQCKINSKDLLNLVLRL